MSKLSEAIATAIWYVKQDYVESYEDLLSRLNTTLDNVEVRVYQEDPSIPLPKYGKDGDAGMDIIATHIEHDKTDNRYICYTGLHFELPKDYEMEIRPRSSNTKYRVALLNAPGTLDEGYRGELLVIFSPLDKDYEFPYKVGDRVCQILVRHREKINWIPVDSLDKLSETSRGKGGFGSTGK